MIKNTEFYNLIFNTIKKEEEELQLLDMSIFDAPELYITFLIAKKLRKSGFNTQREIRLHNNGITDIYIENENNKIAIEFKLKNTLSSYISDILKLKSLDKEYKKYFICLVDSFNEKTDPRIEGLDNYINENNLNINKINIFNSFLSVHERTFKKNIFAILCIYEIH